MESIEKLEKMGYIIKEKNNKIVFSYKSGTISDIKKVERLIKKIKNNEDEAIVSLKKRSIKTNHNTALKFYYLPYEYNKLYGKQLTKNSFIFIQKISKVWISYRITYNEDKEISTQRNIIESKNFINVLNRSEKYIKNYINYIER